MEEKKTDRRVIKTKRAIRNAFAQLLAQKDINDVTITDVANLADVNRKTVYNYYAGTYEILDEMENDLVAAFSAVLGELERKDIASPYEIFHKLTEVINADFDFYSKLIGIDANFQLTRKLATMLRVRINRILSEKIPDRNKANLISDYVTSGMLVAYRGWFHSDRSQSLEEFSREVGTLVFSGINGLVKN